MRDPHVSHAAKITSFRHSLFLSLMSHSSINALQIELWHIFHDELDLDGNGHLDADELASALQHAGTCMFIALTSYVAIIDCVFVFQEYHWSRPRWQNL